MKRPSEQPDLFSTDAYGGTTPTPLARSSDPSTSHEAAERHAASGNAGANANIALAMVLRKPGCTFQELFAAATADEQSKLGSAVELMRRLGDLRRVGMVRNGPARACCIKGTSMMTWEAA